MIIVKLRISVVRSGLIAAIVLHSPERRRIWRRRWRAARSKVSQWIFWGLGCTIVEMATRSNLWPEMKDPASALYRIAFFGDVPEFRGEFSDGAKDFVVKCLMRDSKERWTAAELLQHPFFSSGEEKWSKIWKSPTTMIEQGFGNDLEELDPSRSCTGMDLVSDSPSGRVGALIRDDLNFSDWTAEED
ncbi:hypothetical protein BUALT_Bualt04G0061700 [Buddleja alternifolia]|uniref:Protein kinase domain-containing protein n=1 Tax=Buddleja alternifolia TaxID=168488 RepID=A0AAV6XXY0_9LAMI|nr:hypothetical protein BUALT_Bualt04G0061700 [Buddleja alternifolia]